MSRNFGLGSRSIRSAGRLALERDLKSHSSIDTMSDRWNLFVEWLYGSPVRKMEDITREDVIAYGRHVASMIEAGRLQVATAQNRVSTVNRVMEIARGDRELTVSPTKDCGIPQRTRVSNADQSMPVAIHDALMRNEQIPESNRVILALARALGLRFEEAAKLDARRAYEQATAARKVSIIDGTKGGRRRTVPIVSDEQIDVLCWAASVQDGRSMIPPTMEYVEFRARHYAIARRHGFRTHAERHAYALRRYHEILGCPAPVVVGVKRGAAYQRYVAESLQIPIEAAKARIRKARLRVARELGHSREDVTRAYAL